LVDLVDIGFFPCEGNIFADFFADGAEEIIVDQGVDNAVLIRF